MITGIIKFYYPQEKYGCIVTDQGNEVFFHQKQVKAESSVIQPGKRVAFALLHGGKGIDEAANVIFHH